MGKIFSKPKMPSAPALPTISESSVTTTYTSTDHDPPAGTGGSNADAAPEVSADEQRVQNILTRKRGRLGTIATSLSGVLSDIASNSSSLTRKTLLGE